MKKLHFTVVTVVGLFSLVSGSFASADAPIEGRPGRDEIRYMAQMIDHHSMATMMANDCLMRASTEDVTAMCQSMIDKQSSEIQQLEGWLSGWYGVSYTTMTEAAPDDTQEADTMQMNMPMSGMTVVLQGLEGQAYEVVFMETIIGHHKQAIDMSERLLEQTASEGHQELRDFAQKVIDDQSAEIEQLENMIAERQ